MAASGAEILIVDDEAEVCAVLSRILTQKGYRVQTETRAGRALARVRERRFEVILLDLIMPELNGLQLLRQIKQEFDELPIVVLTGQSDLTTAVEAMQAGASDFVSKPVEGAFLDLRIQRAIELERTRRMVKLDSLTGLYNHRFFQDRLEEEIRRGRRYERPLALLLLDIDHFKAFNDTHGHPAGDAMLQEVSRLLRRISRTEDIVARYGGEEFAVILPETPAEGAEVFAVRVKQLLEARPCGATRLPADSKLTVSIGVATLKPESSKASLIEAADRALYQAKREGRNRVCVAA
ncbi:MAG: diguanylate cyclase [Myxococcales bacterium]|nr:diguanylate cyclase [Myxococcales bacterium]MDH5306064.1 diguanylate cyclase [Myxococcales bacterium]MDH5567008.1 diguanylate cyclase [Myxococcales bacterium]